MLKIIFLLIVTCYLLIAPAAQAQIMSNQDYIINISDLNTEADNAVNVNKPASIVEKPVVIKSSSPFSVSLSSDLVDFGELTPTNPLIRTVSLNMQSPSPLGYSLLAFEDHPLKKNPDASGDFIPNTTCDNGNCTEKNADEWISTLTYGFGYRCDNITGFDCDPLFLKSNFYKHFANASGLQSPEEIARGTVLKEKSIRLSYKVNISGTQPKGSYGNTITYIAIPNF